MRATAAIAAVGALAAQSATAASVEAKNVIYVVPDGYGPASQNMARDLASLLETGTTGTNPQINELPVDAMAVGLVRTHSANRMITDSAASGTAFAAGFKSNNGAISVLPDGRPVGSILEAAKLAGLKTGLVVTSIIEHATPAVYAAHTTNRNNYALIAEQQIGYSHPLGNMVDVLFGGGRCYYFPQGEGSSCRSDDVDLFGYARSQGFSIAKNRAEFDTFQKGLGNTSLPLLGLFNDGDMRYEIDRAVTQDEPSLVEMTETAINALHRSTSNGTEGFFIMIEASRIDHAGHDNDPAGHAVDTWMYNDVMAWARDWIDEHPDTILMSAADHETGGLTLNGYDPLPIAGANHSRSYIQSLWNDRPSGADDRQFLVSEILPAYGLDDASDSEINTILDASSIGSELASLLSDRAGVHWSTGGHSAIDVTLFGYAAEDKLPALKADLAGGWDNTELPRYIEEVLGLDMDSVTELLREAADEDDSWLGRRDLESRDAGVDEHHH